MVNYTLLFNNYSSSPNGLWVSLKVWVWVSLNVRMALRFTAKRHGWSDGKLHVGAVVRSRDYQNFLRLLFTIFCYPWCSAERTSREFRYKHLESLPDTRSQIFDWKQFAIHSFSLFGGIRLSPQTTERVNQRLAFHRRNDGRVQKFADS